MTQTPEPRPLPLAGLLAFAATSIPTAALELALAVHLPRYFASHMGLGLALVGTAFALVRLIDIPLDPLIGLAMDRSRTRFGRYRLWTLGGAPVLMAALYALMHPPAASGEAYLVGALLAMFLGYSALLLSQLAWAAALAPAYEQRSRIFAAITGLGVTGAVGVLVAPVIMGKLGYSDAQGVQAMVWFVIAATPAAALVMTARTPERIAPDHARGFRLGDYRTLLTRPNILRLMASDLCIRLGPGWMAGLYLFYFTAKLGFDASQANLLLLIYIASGFVGAPLVAWLARAASKHRALQASTALYSLCLIALPFAPKGNFAAVLPQMVVAGAAFTAFLVMLRALTADIADEMRLASGREWTGLVFSLTNATTKLATAAAIFLTFRILAGVGFDPREGAVNTPAALRGLEVAFLAGPIVFVTVGGLCFLGYRLDSARHAEIRLELDRRDALHAADAAAASAPDQASLRAISRKT